MYGLANSGTISENFRIFVVKLQKDNQKKTMLNFSICTNCTFIWCIFFLQPVVQRFKSCT